ncbi:trihelix transcription factor GTL2-like [Harpegnathos saltator]|uniref:trihelix transcription factor GTL2-like n=1 Tax=Harpegnathos saltator TaxID=610380 RepID=UPI000DBEED6B|nr:trihelix transcription factor GTL2-like [Harpegnathos saltator]
MTHLSFSSLGYVPKSNLGYHNSFRKYLCTEWLSNDSRSKSRSWSTTKCSILSKKLKEESGRILVTDKISRLLFELPLSPKVMEYFDICVTDKNETLPEKATEVNASSVWNDKSVKLLFSLYEDYQDEFKSTVIKNDTVWDKIKVQMNISGNYNVTRTQIKDKWTNMRKVYMRIKDHNKKTGVTLKTCRYYNEMDCLYGGKPNVNPVKVVSNMRLEAEDENTSSAENSAADNNESKKQKKIKIERHLSSWTENFIEYRKERDNCQEQRNAEKIIAIENATKTFRENTTRQNSFGNQIYSIHM